MGDTAHRTDAEREAGDGADRQAGHRGTGGTTAAGDTPGAKKTVRTAAAAKKTVGTEAGRNETARTGAGVKRTVGTGGGRNKNVGTASGRRKTGRRRKPAGNRKQPILESFRHAFDGISAGLGERNMQIHCVMAALVVFFGFLLHITVTEWCICLGLFGLIMGLELVNTAVEAVVDLVTQDYHPLAKKAKDTAAGAVLIAAIMAAAAGLIIFVPRLLYFVRSILPV